MRRSVRFACAAGAAVALAVTTAAPAGAQETLGVEFDASEGSPGDVVNGVVDTDDVAAHCNNSPEELQDRFVASQDVMFDMVPDVFGADILDFTIDPAIEVTFTVENLTFLAMAVVAEQVGQNLGLAEEAFPQTFVTTFADIATQAPVGEQGNFDRETGEGSVVVPDLDPGFWGIAAACVSPSTDPDFLLNAASNNAPLVAPVLDEFLDTPEWAEEWENLTGEPWTGLPVTMTVEVMQQTAFFFLSLIAAQQVGEDLVPAMVEPDALGAEIFCILDADGECPEDEVPVPDDELDDEAPPAEAVVVQPAFTG